MIIKPRNNVFDFAELGGQVVCSKMEHTTEQLAIISFRQSRVLLTQVLKNKELKNAD